STFPGWRLYATECSGDCPIKLFDDTNRQVERIYRNRLTKQTLFEANKVTL
ncbi:MAG: hypothetical protein ACI94L_001457, partial [Flavobacteriaceae bacterium]